MKITGAALVVDAEELGEEEMALLIKERLELCERPINAEYQGFARSDQDRSCDRGRFPAIRYRACGAQLQGVRTLWQSTNKGFITVL